MNWHALATWRQVNKFSVRDHTRRCSLVPSSSMASDSTDTHHFEPCRDYELQRRCIRRVVEKCVFNVQSWLQPSRQRTSSLELMGRDASETGLLGFWVCCSLLHSRMMQHSTYSSHTRHTQLWYMVARPAPLCPSQGNGRLLCHLLGLQC